MVLLDFFYNSQVGPWYHHVIFYSSSPWVIYNIHVGEFVKFLFIKATLQRFEAFNSLLEQNIEVSYIGKPTFDIDQYITLHKNLCDLVALFNEIYGLNMLISMFQTIIYVLRLCLAVLYAPQFIFIAFVLMWTFNAIIQCIIVAAMCQKVVYEADKTITLSYKALYHYSNMPVMKQKLFILSQQTAARCPQFTAAGFFSVDNSMLFTFVNLITNYVIVFIQFSQNNSASKIKTNILENNTSLPLNYSQHENSLQ
ncbi:putative gustatory receptor 28a [Atheta coriaria]|uniref:putative gustatory receptor 28a n=1 Tax=Dalotia coriaria TaxID=877792 RepID=UPI0031F35D1A